MRPSVTNRQFLEELADATPTASAQPLFIVTRWSKDGTVTRSVLRGKKPESDNERGVLDKVTEIVGRKSGVLKKTEVVEIQEGSARVIVEVIDLPPTLVILGAGHVGSAVARLASLLAYDVVLVDDRMEFLFGEKLAEADIVRIKSSFEDAQSKVEVHGNTAIVIVTRGHQSDEICLRQFVTSEARYIGMIGSKRRVLGVMNRLREFGVSDMDLQKVYAPIGLRIGAVSPEEIAVSILAEIISVFNQEKRDK
jgi:xanthine/CO dehydrogenase XdhC/CoxF family maturation factor